MARVFNLTKRTSYYLAGFVGVFVLLVIIRVQFFEDSSSLEPVTKLAVTVRRRFQLRGSQADADERRVTDSSEGGDLIDEFDWDAWVAMQAHFHPIGDIWDKCDNQTRKKLGKIVLAPNAKSKGFHIEVFINVTVGGNITSGSSELEVKYKGLRLYTKAHDLCTVTQKMETPLKCPFLAGSKLSIMDSVNLPSFIPKGDYAISAIIKDQEKKEVGCVYAAFQTGGDR